MFLSEEISKKWSPVLDHPELAPIKDPYRKAVTAVILENQEKAFYEENNILREATHSNAAGSGGFGGGANAGGPVRDVLRASARGEFEEARTLTDPEAVARALVVGRDALGRALEKVREKAGEGRK